MRPAPDLGLRPRPRGWWVALVASVAVHALLLSVWIEARLPRAERPGERLIVLAPAEPERPRSVVTPYYSSRESRRSNIPPTRTSPPRRERASVSPPPIPLRTPEIVTVDTQTTPAAAAKIRPDLGTGQLWVRPLPLPPKELAQRITKSQAELVDSAVNVIIQAFLDSIANEPGADQAKVPDWTKEVAGLKFGLDAKNVYIAGLKIPAAVLALLPLGGTNQSRAFDRSDELYADLRRAAARANTMAEFKQAIKELRERKEREREFEKNQRTAPPPEHPATP